MMLWKARSSLRDEVRKNNSLHINPLAFAAPLAGTLKRILQVPLTKDLGIYKTRFFISKTISTQSLIIFLLLFFALNFSSGLSAEPISLFGKASIENSPRLVKIKIPFNSAQANIGVYKSGFIKDEKKTHVLKPMMKYRIRLNAKGSYDLLIVKGEQVQTIASLEAPITLSTDLGDSAVFFNDSWYHGQISLQQLDSGLTAINELDLEYAIWGLIGPMVRMNDSADAVKAAAIIVRSSLFALTFSEAKSDYHLNGSTLNFKGIDSEKEFLVKLIKGTDGEVLFTAHGEILFTPLRTMSSNVSAPFEFIGSSTKAWEKVFTLREIEMQLAKAGIHTGPISSFKQSVTSSWHDVEPYVSGPIILVDGLAEDTNLEMNQAQNIFGLPSPFFRIYSFETENGETHIQFIGNMPNQPNGQVNEPVFNLVRSIHETSSLSENYKQILKRLYPNAYLGRV